MRVKNKTTVRAILVYIVLTFGLQMFLYACANSYNRLNDEKITPASLIVNDGNAELKILDKSYNFSFRGISPENKAYFIAYRHHIVIETIQFTGIIQIGIRKITEIIRAVEAERLFKRYADLVHSICDKLRTYKAMCSRPVYIEVYSDKPKKIIGVNFPVICEMFYYFVIFSFLFRRNFNAVYFARYIVESP